MERTPAPVERPVVTTVAGSDSGGGAGIQADLKTIEARGAFGTSVLTSVTAQNTRGVESSHVLPVEEVRAQLEAVRSDFEVQAFKTGMLAVEPIVESVAEELADANAPAVVDPVMVAESGDRLLDRGAEAAYEDLVAAATVVTPNAEETRVLTGVEPVDVESAVRAGEQLVGWGADAALVTGGHVPGEEVVDVLVTDEAVGTFAQPRVDTEATHGSGCTLSSAIAAELAQGRTVHSAVETASSFLERAVRYPLDVGQGPGSVHHAVEVRNEAARHDTREAVESVVSGLVDADVSALLPEVGTNVVGATPYAERVGETAAVEGRIAPTFDGVRATRGVRFGASSHVARFLLAAREFDPGLRFACNLRYDDEVRTALAATGWTVGSYDRSEQPTEVEREEGNTMQWGTRRAVESVEGTPVAVTDPGAVGKEPMTKLLARDPGTLLDRVETLLTAVAEN